VVAHVNNPRYTRGIGRRIAVESQPQQKCKTLAEKVLKQQRAGGMAQMVEHLPDKCEALSSNLVPTKNILFKNTSKK
jgi:hypothetical protein